MATYQNGDYPNLKYLPGVKIEFIPKITGDFVEDACSWLKDNGSRIDVIYTFHVCERTKRFIHDFKSANPNGKVYVEMDGWINRRKWLEKIIGDRLYNFLYELRRGYISGIYNQAFVTTEFQEKADEMTKKLNHKIACVPNPVNPDEVAPMRKFKDRSNIIFTSARLGTKQKATEILLSSFVKIADQIPNWKLKLAGGFSENVNIADDFYKAHPELQERVIFTGQVSDRASLIEMYRDAKIFAFPSRFESFGISLSEAMSQGCFPIVSEIESSRMLTDNFKYAFHHKVDDVDKLAECLLNACMNENKIEAIAKDGMNFINNICGLEKCCNTIYKGLYNEI